MKNKTLIKLLNMVVVIFALFLFASCGSSSSDKTSARNEETSNNTSEVTSTTTSASEASSTTVSTIPTGTNTSEITNTTTATSEAIETTTKKIDDKTYYTVSFNSNGGTDVESQQVEDGKKATKPNNPTKKGYTFVNWTYQGEEWDFIGYSVIEDMTLEANWTINQYELTLTSNDSGDGSISGAGIYDYNSDVTITATPYTGYTFVGWYNGETQVSTDQIYTFIMPAKKLSLEARFTANTNTAYKVEHYKQNIDNDEYTLYETDNLTGTTDTLTNASAKTYEGFTSPSITQQNIDGDGSTVIKLYYTKNSYTLTLSKNNDEAGTITDKSGTYIYAKEITIVATPNTGYTFIGWYDGEEQVSDEAEYIFTMPAKNLSLEARFTISKYTITLDNQAEGVEITGITSGNEYEYNSEITLTATNIPSGYTIIWSRSDGVTSTENTYTFNVPANAITITITSTITARPYTIEDNKIYFGSYPQTKVTDESLISSLNTKAGTLPTSTALGNWTDYNYYISSNITSYMYYQDIDYDNDGDYDYRGVYFTKYRPIRCSDSSSTSNSNQDDNGYSTNIVYWFSFDPIEWDILTKSNGKALIIANLILDYREYYPSYSIDRFSHNGDTGYANNYELSNIRKWLNDNFYNTAFNDLQKAIIETTEVYNNLASTGDSSNKYVCNNTNDKMFLLSYKEATTYYTSSTARQCKGTDYAKCQGLFVVSSTGNSWWWLRSPSTDDAGLVYSVRHDGYVGNGNVIYNYGIRPACYINL